MSHLRPTPLRQRVLPALLLSAITAAGVGLWALPAKPAGPATPAPAQAVLAAPSRIVEPAALALSTSTTSPASTPRPVDAALPAAQPVQDIATVAIRASRSRRVEAAVAARARAEAAVRAARARAVAQAKQRAAEERARNARVCPAPSASFIDSWGDSRSGGRGHEGTDMMASAGDPIYAVRSGTIETDSGGNGGNSIYLTDADGDTYYYAHNAENLVSDGEQVLAGELIARVGSSGNASAGAPHLHFELQPGGGAAVPSYDFLREIC